MDNIKGAANYVGDKVQEATSGASKETNKQVAKDGNAPLGTRVTAAKDAVGDKLDEHGHQTAASLNKERAKHA